MALNASHAIKFSLRKTSVKATKLSVVDRANRDNRGDDDVAKWQMSSLVDVRLAFFKLAMLYRP